MSEYKPFSVVRIREEGPNRGPDRITDLFCIKAQGNHELIRTGESESHVLMNGCSGKDARQMVQQLCDRLNEAWNSYFSCVEAD